MNTTPGPWHLTKHENEIGEVSLVVHHTESGHPICRMGGNVTQINVERNGVAIAALPDLLEALRMWSNFMKANYRPTDMPDIWEPTVAALAKADA